jgi:hypothetical protein
MERNGASLNGSTSGTDRNETERIIPDIYFPRRCRRFAKGSPSTARRDDALLHGRELAAKGARQKTLPRRTPFDGLAAKTLYRRLAAEKSRQWICRLAGGVAEDSLQTCCRRPAADTPGLPPTDNCQGTAADNPKTRCQRTATQQGRLEAREPSRKTCCSHGAIKGRRAAASDLRASSQWLSSGLLVGNGSTYNLTEGDKKVESPPSTGTQKSISRARRKVPSKTGSSLQNGKFSV